MKIPSKSSIYLSAGLALAGTSGVLASTALGIGSAAPTAQTTTTINLATGPTGSAGPQGPTGPQGPSGLAECPTGYSFGDLVINHPGGHVTIFTCIKNQ